MHVALLSYQVVQILEGLVVLLRLHDRILLECALLLGSCQRLRRKSLSFHNLVWHISGLVDGCLVDAWVTDRPQLILGEPAGLDVALALRQVLVLVVKRFQLRVRLVGLH